MQLPETLSALFPFPVQYFRPIVSALIKSTKKEILLFSTSNTFYRQECIGAIKLVEEAAASNSEVKVTILTKIDDRIKISLQKLKNNYKFKVV